GKVLACAAWRFNWIDIDPLGFAESADIDVSALLDLSESEAVLCITNGGWHADRFGTRTKLVETLTSRVKRHGLDAQQDQRDQLMRKVLEAEAAYRIEQAAEISIALYPLLLYDGRHGHSGVVRSYYLLSRKGNPNWSRSYVEFDSKASLSVLSP